MVIKKLHLPQLLFFWLFFIMILASSGCTFNSWKLPRESAAHKFIPYSPPWLNTPYSRGSFSVFKRPNTSTYNNEIVGIFAFQPPSYATGVGSLAATILHQKLLKYKIYWEVNSEIYKGELPLRTQIEVATIKGYDLIITGEIKYYFDGGITTQSRVDQQIKIIDVKTEEILWYIEAVEIGNPIYAANCRLFKIRGEEAPSTMKLMSVTSEKLCKVMTRPRNPMLPLSEKNLSLNIPDSQK